MQHRALRPVLGLCTLTALAFGCQADEPADADSARAGWRSATLAMAEAGVDAGQWSGSATVDENEVSAMVTGSVPCPEGGSLELDADAHTSAEIVATSLDIEFHDCGADGVVIDGHLETAAEVTDTKVSTSITGELSFSGNAHGTCEIDIGATVTHGATTTVSSHASVCGYGHDALSG